MLERIEAAPRDAILGLTVTFNADPRAEKINLSVGVYQDETGKTPLLECVKEAERLLSLGNVRGINPVMRWMMLNAVVNTNNRGERKLDKQASPEKIDGAVAWVMALSEAMALVEDSEVGVGWA